MVALEKPNNYLHYGKNRHERVNNLNTSLAEQAVKIHGRAEEDEANIHREGDEFKQFSFQPRHVNMHV